MRRCSPVSVCWWLLRLPGSSCREWIPGNDNLIISVHNKMYIWELRCLKSSSFVGSYFCLLPCCGSPSLLKTRDLLLSSWPTHKTSAWWGFLRLLAPLGCSSRGGGGRTSGYKPTPSYWRASVRGLCEADSEPLSSQQKTSFGIGELWPSPATGGQLERGEGGMKQSHLLFHKSSVAWVSWN